MTAFIRQNRYGDDASARAAVAASLPRPRNDYDVLREQHRFVWTDDDLAEMDWEKEQAHKYCACFSIFQLFFH